MSCPFCGTPEGQGACACCGHFIAKEQPEPDPEETEALTDLRTIVSWWAGMTEDLDRTKYNV